MQNNFKHQGDVPLFPFSGQVEGTVIAKGEYILAYGEVTGHKHRLVTTNPEDLIVTKTNEGYIILNLTAPGELTHEEHLTIEVLPGTYRVGGEREYDWFGKATRRVVD